MKRILLFIIVLATTFHVVASDRLYANSIETTAGSTFTLTLCLQSTDPMCGFQCVVNLPQGVTPVTDTFGDLVYDLGARTTSKRHTISCVTNNDGAIQVLCYSSTAQPFANLDGDVATIVLKADDTMNEGNHTISLTDIVISSPNDVTGYLSDETVTLTVKDQLACIVTPFTTSDSNTPVYNVIGQASSNPSQRGWSKLLYKRGSKGLIICH